MPLQNMPLWYTDYLGLKGTEEKELEDKLSALLFST